MTDSASEIDNLKACLRNSEAALKLAYEQIERLKSRVKCLEDELDDKDFALFADDAESASEKVSRLEKEKAPWPQWWTKAFRHPFR